MNNAIGKAFEELDDAEMYAINGGGGTVVTITTWSSAPCTISAGAVSVISIATYTIYQIFNFSRNLLQKVDFLK